MVDWSWVDYFARLPINTNNYKFIKELNYKLSIFFLVSKLNITQ
jgi:hypothetical protein